MSAPLAAGRAGRETFRRIPPRLPLRWALTLAVAVPIVISAVLGQFPLVANTSAALILVLVIVGAASIGYRSAGLIAAAVSGLAFDFFLTAPFRSLAITGSADIETLVVLALVGVAVTELVQLGRRAKAQVRDQDDYLNTLLSMTDPDRIADHRWIGTVTARLANELGLDRCEWSNDPDPHAPQLHRDGQIRLGRRTLPMADGLPTDSVIVLPTNPEDPRSPAFVLTAATHVARPTLRQRRLAGALAEQTGWALKRDVDA